MALIPVWFNLYCPVSTTKAAAQGAKCWLLDSTNGHLYNWNPITNLWVQHVPPTSTSPLVSIYAAVDGSVLGLTSNGNIYQYTESTASWIQLFITSYSATHAAIGGTYNIVIVDDHNSITSYINTITADITGQPVKVTATAGLSELWGLGSSGTVYRWNSSTSLWNTVGTKTLAQLHVSVASDNTLQVFGVDSNGKGWSMNTSTNTWTAIVYPYVGAKYTSLEGGAGYIWGTTVAGEVFRGSI